MSKLVKLVTLITLLQGSGMIMGESNFEGTGYLIGMLIGCLGGGLLGIWLKEE